MFCSVPRELSSDSPRNSLPTGPAYDSGEELGVISDDTSSATDVMVVLELRSLLQRFAYRQRTCTSKGYACGGALINDEADEIEEDRDDRDDTSEIIDSGDEADEIEFANEDRRGNGHAKGDDEVWACHFSCADEAYMLDA